MIERKRLPGPASRSTNRDVDPPRQTSLREFHHREEPPWRDEGLLRDLYLRRELTSYEIAELFECNPATVQNWLHEFDVPVRGPGGSPRDANYKDEDWLRTRYIDEEWSAYEISKKEGISTNTVYKWLEEFDITRRPAASEIDGEAPYVDSMWLREKYVDDDRSAKEIGGMAGVDPNTIRTWLHRHGIPVDDPGRKPLPYASYFITSAGYPAWRSYVRESRTEEQVAVHRLLMAASHSLEEMAGKQVHHKNGIRWDNRPDNLELKTPEEHARHHANMQDHERDERGRFT